ncbi:cyd operon YbgE family protein [Nitrogeniibacter aestuarii]|uniref:cyd operon YbgE family protein n=1 Tax=Nitrogeniibacter aestuarii TaxID=2815343 RepID=UPI001D113DA4|nr:cyd operon YbgE family protein [Nitrogeniibacter aestuarii]
MSTATEPDTGTRIAWLPLLAAIAITLGITANPRLLADGAGSADHWAAMALFWAMSAGFVRGVGFIPRQPVLRWLFSGWACAVGIGLALLRLL